MDDARKRDLRARVDRVQRTRNRKPNAAKLIMTFVTLAVTGPVVNLVVWGL